MKKLKHLITTKYTALLIVLAIGSAFFSSGVAMAGTPMGVAYCFLNTTGITYQCGPGTGDATLDGTGSNDCSTVPIYDTNNNLVSGPTCEGNSLYQFVAGNCYTYGINPNGIQSWTKEADCSSDDFNNVSPKTFAMPTDLTTNVPDNAGFANCSKNSNTCDLVLKYVNPIIAFLSVSVGIVVVISVVLGGIQYSSAGDNPQATAAAKRRIINALLAGACFLFLLGFIEFLVPGGFLNSP